jgi:RimJ/RimL family protein N-acetyltransferase
MTNAIYLRRVEISDLSTLLLWENDPNNWEISEVKHSFSEEEIADFIVNQQAPINALDQIRWMICLKNSHEAIGTIDLFEIHNNQAGVGILIQSTHHRNKGNAKNTCQRRVKIRPTVL